MTTLELTSMSDDIFGNVQNMFEISIAQGNEGEMIKHKCRQKKYCQCDSLALEPDEYCPIHGGCWRQPRCDMCGRFFKETKEK